MCAAVLGSGLDRERRGDNKMENPYNGPSAFMVQVETNKWLTEHGGHP